MTKGPNWQARADAETRMRQEKRAEKEARAAGLLIEPDQILLKIFSIDPGDVWSS